MRNIFRNFLSRSPEEDEEEDDEEDDESEGGGSVGAFTLAFLDPAPALAAAGVAGGGAVGVELFAAVGGFAYVPLAAAAVTPAVFG